MSEMVDKVSKPYLEQSITPSELPDSCPAEHPLPWRIAQAGNGHFYIYDAKDVLIAHVYCWDNEENQIFVAKIKKVAGQQVSWR